jgi:hypothetical protein
VHDVGGEISSEFTPCAFERSPPHLFLYLLLFKKTKVETSKDSAGCRSQWRSGGTRRILVESVGMRKGGGASWFKSTQIDPNAPEMNVYNDLNVERKNEGERRAAGPTLSGVALGF